VESDAVRLLLPISPYTIQWLAGLDVVGSILRMTRFQQRLTLWGALAGAIILASTFYLFGHRVRQRHGSDRERANIILISVDTLRPDHLSASGYGRDTSPFVDSLAKTGVRFVNVFAQASWTLPSHMSMFTSTYPRTHQVENTSRSLPESIPTVAEVLRRDDYHTVGFITWIYLSSKFGFARGFDRYNELLPPPRKRNADTKDSVKAEDLVDRVSVWIRSRPASPYFLFLHFFDPHMNYAPPLDYARRFDPTLTSVEPGSHAFLKAYIPGLHENPTRVPPAVRDCAVALYDGEIRYTDDQLRRLFGELESAGLLANTWVFLTSDHGEEFDEHGSMEGHQWTLYDEVLRVPLAVVPPPGKRMSRTVSQMVETIDIAPTILAVTGSERPSNFEGRSLLPWIAGETPADWEEISFSRIRRFNEKCAVRTPLYKLIYTNDTHVNSFGVPVKPGFELYNLVNDPAEQNDIWKPNSPVARELADRLGAFELKRSKVVDVRKPELSPEEIERLRNLGYVGK
jgi:arylsulfatase A-like enzyme